MKRRRRKQLCYFFCTKIYCKLFFTLGIGSFATSTSVFKIGKLMPDKMIPGTLNVAITTSVVMEALIFMTFAKVDILTLVLMISFSMLVAYFGASIVSKITRSKNLICDGCWVLLYQS
ncbi:sulfite exporter TauE/SafE family protein [Carnobacterium iners]|uniref:sulfite exporter TauE/SafE family protein n=1 Tax=Carnobacterium iners TaxID=1073423 RepID=UPI0008C6FA93|nr:sulfite exporter TauE/SafE family protein [Carnobacterium iners]SEK19436.1 hypothetical protein SAMN04488114_101111 [Carnobacterium iners]